MSLDVSLHWRVLLFTLARDARDRRCSSAWRPRCGRRASRPTTRSGSRAEASPAKARVRSAGRWSWPRSRSRSCSCSRPGSSCGPSLAGSPPDLGLDEDAGAAGQPRRPALRRARRGAAALLVSAQRAGGRGARRGSRGRLADRALERQGWNKRFVVPGGPMLSDRDASLLGQRRDAGLVRDLRDARSSPGATSTRGTGRRAARRGSSTRRSCAGSSAGSTEPARPRRRAARARSGRARDRRSRSWARPRRRLPLAARRRSSRPCTCRWRSSARTRTAGPSRASRCARATGSPVAADPPDRRGRMGRVDPKLSLTFRLFSDQVGAVDDARADRRDAVRLLRLPRALPGRPRPLRRHVATR